ncbi:hypothetical protein IWW48_000716 [Coemansia sp. RSA 1200]|nr:hypothetical protein IWW48_000716 [Coemansia sp. RSA 1200]
MVVTRSTHTYKPSTSVCLGTKNASGAFPTRRFMHANFDVPSAGAGLARAGSAAFLDVSASADHHSSQEQPHRQTRGSRLIAEITPKYVQQLLSELEQERAANYRASRKIEALREEVECLKEDKSRLEEDKSELEVCLGEFEVGNSLLKAELTQARNDISQFSDESEVLREECIALEQLLHDAHSENCSNDETALASDSSSSFESDHDMEGGDAQHAAIAELSLDSNSLSRQPDSADDEICAHAYFPPTPVCLPALENDYSMEDGNSQLAGIEELRFDCDDSQQRITTLEKQVYELAEKLEQTCDQVNRDSQDTLCSHEQEVTIAPAAAESVHDKTCPRNKINGGSTGLLTPTESVDFKIFFNAELGSLKSLQPDTMVASLPQPTPTSKTALAKAAAKSAKAATKAAATKAAKAIRKVAVTAMAHMHHHH